MASNSSITGATAHTTRSAAGELTRRKSPRVGGRLLLRGLVLAVLLAVVAVLAVRVLTLGRPARDALVVAQVAVVYVAIVLALTVAVAITMITATTGLFAAEALLAADWALV